MRHYVKTQIGSSKSKIRRIIDWLAFGLILIVKYNMNIKTFRLYELSQALSWNAIKHKYPSVYLI